MQIEGAGFGDSSDCYDDDSDNGFSSAINMAGDFGWGESFSEKLKNNLDDFIESVSSSYKIDNFDNAYDIEISSDKDIQSELITLLSANAKVLNFKVQEPNLEDAIIKLLEVS